MKLINKTEHPVFLMERRDVDLNPVPADSEQHAAYVVAQWKGCPKDEVARVDMVDEEMPPLLANTPALDSDEVLVVPITSTTLTEVVNLPEPQYGVGYIVSTLVRQACPYRRDLFTPYPLYRGAQGIIEGCFGFAVNA